MHAHLAELALPELVEELQVLRVDLPLRFDADLWRCAGPILHHPRQCTVLHATHTASHAVC